MAKVSKIKKDKTREIWQSEDIPDQSSFSYEKIFEKIFEKLNEKNDYLIEKNFEITENYERLVERNNEELRSLKKSIQKLENKLDRINEARSISVEIPEELVFED